MSVGRPGPACLVWGAFLLVSCGPEPGPGEVEIGTAAQNADPAFVELNLGDRAVLALGGQGGLHFNMHLRMRDHPAFDGQPGWLRAWTRQVDTGELVSRLPGLPGYFVRPSQGVVQTEWPVLNVLCPPPVGLQVVGVPLEVRVEVRSIEAPNGPVLREGQTRFTPVCPPDDRTRCRDLCNVP